jgi:small conductance mechanosensitive channel
MDEIIVKIEEVLALYGLKVVAAIITLIVGRIIAGIVRSVIRKAMTRAKVDPMLISFTTSVSYIALMAFVVVSALGRLGFATTSFVAILGAAGLAIGLALQGSLSNFASGVLMIIFKPFQVGNFIEAGGTAGIVEEITIFNTVMKTPDNRKIIVPNSSITGGNITNNSANPIRRIDLTIGVSYSDDLDKVRSVLEDVLKKETRMLAEPAYFIGISELADSSVNFAVRPWVNSADWWPTRCDLQETIKKRFDQEGICIPFPQQDVHMHQVNESA